MLLSACVSGSSRGTYCPIGSPAPINCEPGFFGDRPELMSADECQSCRPGHECAAGSASEKPCEVGTFAEDARSASCTRCRVGTYQDAIGQTSCKVCLPGFWCTPEKAISCSQDSYQPSAGQWEQLACIPCSNVDPHSFTNGSQGCTSPLACICRVGYFNFNATASSTPQCHECVSGTSCTDPGTTLATIPIKRGYYRLSSKSLDVRRCPDASTNCSESPECPESTSGCVGSLGSEVDMRTASQSIDSILCSPSLTGPFCRLCRDHNMSIYYAVATSSKPARCARCDDMAGKTILVAFGVVLGFAVLARALTLLYEYRISTDRQAQLTQSWTLFSPHNKLKIALGFCARPLIYWFQLPLLHEARCEVVHD